MHWRLLRRGAPEIVPGTPGDLFRWLFRRHAPSTATIATGKLCPTITMIQPSVSISISSPSAEVSLLIPGADISKVDC